MSRLAGKNLYLRTAKEKLIREIRKPEKEKPVIAPETTFTQWCEQLGSEGLLVDGHPFRLDDRPAMKWIYDQIPSSIQEANKKRLILQKSAQIGFTVFEILAMMYLALKFKVAIGFYLPDRSLASIKSQERFMPIARTIPAVYEQILSSSGRIGGEGNILIRNMGTSRFYFMHISGSLTESVPLDVVSFDEVQFIRVSDIEKTSERMSASSMRYTVMGSTANFEDQDINFWYKTGTQHQFWTECGCCGEYQLIHEHFPNCVKFDVAIKDYRYQCYSCNGWIEDPQRGEWRALFPDNKDMSIHFPQTLSPTISPREMIESYFNATDLKNFWNRKLGKPYSDPSQVPINLEILNNAIAEGIRLGVAWKHNGSGLLMAIDQMGAYNVVLIAERLPTGHMAIVHAEEIYSPDPFMRCIELMENFNISVCVLEQLPNFNDAHRFAKLEKHRGRVFLVNYTDMPDEWLKWGDSVPSRAEIKTAEEERVRYTVTVDQYRAMQMSFARITKKMCVFPDPDGLYQKVIDKGYEKTVNVLRDRVFNHFLHTALIAVKDEEKNTYRRKVCKISIDPHYSYALMMLNVAWARAYGTSQFIIPDYTKEIPMSAQLMPGLPHDVAAVIDEKRTEICGYCSAFEQGLCNYRNLMVKETDPACDAYLEK